MLKKRSKLFWLISATVLVGLFEFLSLAGVNLPAPIAIPFFLFFIVLVGYKTIWHGLVALIKFDFKNINLLMVIAVLGALYLGEYPEAAIVIVLFSLAEHLEVVGIAKSQSALNHLINQMPKTVLIKGQKQPVKLSEIKIGEIILIKPGEMIPLDGIVNDGVSFVDESAITGESLAKDKRKGDPIFSGTLNKNGALEIIVTRNEEDSTIEKIRELTFNATLNKAKTEQFIEQFSQYYIPLIILLALFWMLFPWLALGRPFERGFVEALSLLVIACPCALVISTPISIFSAIGNASSAGALIKGGKYLEAIGQIKAMAIDKTRTLTYGTSKVAAVLPFGKESRELLLSCVAGIEALSEHPLAQTVVEAARQEKLTPHAVKNFESFVGQGAKAECLVCDDKYHRIGKLQFIREVHQIPEEVEQIIDKYQQEGKTVIVVSTQKGIRGIIAVEDQVRKDGKKLIQELNQLGIESVMLTGDHANVAHFVANEMGIKNVKADLLPDEKLKAIKEIVKNYKVVGMFGDGINDAPALAQANVGISMSSLGSDTALEAASIVILNDRLDLIPFLVRLGRKTIQIIKFNTSLAIAIKLLFILLAVFGYSHIALAIFADVGVTLIVILISLRLMHWKP